MNIGAQKTHLVIANFGYLRLQKKWNSNCESDLNAWDFNRWHNKNVAQLLWWKIHRSRGYPPVKTAWSYSLSRFGTVPVCDRRTDGRAGRRTTLLYRALLHRRTVIIIRPIGYHDVADVGLCLHYNNVMRWEFLFVSSVFFSDCTIVIIHSV